MSDRTLYIVCPFSCMESFIAERIGGGGYFLSVAAAVPDLEDAFTVESISDLVEREGIGAVCVVNDASCRFIDAVVSGSEVPIAKVGENLIECFETSGLSGAQALSYAEKRLRLAEFNVMRQVQRMRDNERLSRLLSRRCVRIKGLATSRAHGLLLDLNTECYKRVVREHRPAS